MDKTLDPTMPLSKEELCLGVLGLSPHASQEEIDAAYAHLVADITPGTNAEHAKVSYAQQLLSEVQSAYNWLATAA